MIDETRVTLLKSVQTHPSDAGTQIAALNGVRGLAILLVLLIHLQQSGVVPAKFHLVNVLMNAGWCGVDLFFVLSGFLITLGLLDSKEAVNYFSAFYMRRVLRIFPLYYAVLGVAILCSGIFAGYSPNMPLFSDSQSGSIFASWQGWISHLLYLQNWWMPWKEPLSRNILGHFWSLGVEEQFYLVWPLCVWLLPRRRLPVLCVAVCLAVLALRFYLLGPCNLSPQMVFRNTVTRADTLMVGALCAIVVRDPTWFAAVRRWLPALAIPAVAYLAVVGFGIKNVTKQVYDTETLGFTAFALIFGAVVLWAYWFNGRGNWFDRVFSMRPLTSLGKYSYGLYVYHVPVVIFAKIIFGTKPWFGHEILPGLLFCVGVVVVAIGVAIASYELFEKRFLRLKRYYKPVYRHSMEAHVSPSQVSTAAEAT